MAKHKSESTDICMDNTRISEKTFFVPLGFGGYFLTIVYICFAKICERIYFISKKKKIAEIENIWLLLLADNCSVFNWNCVEAVQFISDSSSVWTKTNLFYR